MNTSETTAGRLNEIVDGLVERKYRNFLATDWLPFDIEKPNIHDSKKEFQAEYDAVHSALNHLDALFNVFFSKTGDDDPDQRRMVDRVAGSVDRGARQQLGGKRVQKISELIRKNVAEDGLFLMAFLVQLDLRRELASRLRELQDQELEFWSVSNRPPNYYARTIALRLARLYSRETGKKPTFGLARDGGHPSTAFGRALEQVFEVLDIKASVRGPAEWAIKSLTDEDLNPPNPGFLGSMMTAPLPGQGGVTGNALAGIATMLEPSAKDR